MQKRREYKERCEIDRKKRLLRPGDILYQLYKRRNKKPCKIKKNYKLQINVSTPNKNKNNYKAMMKT